MSSESTKEYRSQFAQLKLDATVVRQHWKEIQQYVYPTSGLYLTDDSEKNNGSKRHQKVINGVAEQSLINLAAGMQGGMTSPSRPWFNLGIQNKQLMELTQVRNWLWLVRELMLSVFARSNFYGAVHSLYAEMCAYGTCCMLIEEDFDSIIRCRPFTIGEYYLALDEKYQPTILYRQFSMTAYQMIKEFGEDKVSQAVKESMNTDRRENTFDVIHCIRPEKSKNKNQYESKYFEAKGDITSFLRESKYSNRPFLAARWDVIGSATYGRGQGMVALGDCKMLQKLEEKKLKAIDKLVDPPMNAPVSMKNKGGTIVAGGVNYIDVQQGQQGFSPVYQINPNIRDISVEIANVEQRIRKYFANDMFLSIATIDKTMTATEVAERINEKMLMLGAVVERTQTELLNVVIDRTFEIMLKMGLIPLPPKELQGADLKVEYISLLSQAQKLSNISAIQQLAQYVGGVAAMNPSVLDKFDFDQSVDEFAEAVGIVPSIVRSDDVVNQLRVEKEKQQQLATSKQNLMMAAEAANKAGSTPVNDANALGLMLKRLGYKVPEANE